MARKKTKRRRPWPDSPTYVLAMLCYAVRDGDHPTEKLARGQLRRWGVLSVSFDRELLRASLGKGAGRE